MSLKWIPNALTLLRIAAAPFVAYLVWKTLSSPEVFQKEIFASIAFTLFTLAAVTDWFDGFLARKLDAASELGAKLDLWADKIIVFAVLLGAVPVLPLLAGIGLLALTGRDIYIMQLRAARPDVNLKATFLAKSKTAVIMGGMAIAMLGYALAMRGLRIEDTGGADVMFMICRLGLSLYIFGCVLSLGTGLQYIQAAVNTPKPE